ncbi:hypothetical protein [Konateibacter massiliensis]|uniref:hypothetical protein n=1 Tax=Konateibacter massiliensis TaxID=2002841 RepID=UPI000C157DD7|nr:hypothetical protein [Konateibacter massiliensis]
MKRNEFGEIENPKNKINILILVVAILAVIITGVVYAVKLNDEAASLNAYHKTTTDYYQNEEGNI